MTLQGYRGKGAPDVEITPGGIYLTTREGSFPLRGNFINGDERLCPSDYNTYSGPTTHHDRRTSSKIFQNRNSETLDVPSISSKGGTSLSRMLRRSRSYKISDNRRTSKIDTSTSLRSFDDSGSRRFRTGTPRMPEEMKKGFEQERKRKILATFEKEHKKQMEWKSFNDHSASRNTDANSEYSFNSHINISIIKKKLSEEVLPGVIFIVTGVLLLILSLIRIPLSHWHTYYYASWGAVPPLLFGIAGVFHKTDYLIVYKNFFYILLGLVTASMTIVTSFLSMKMVYAFVKALIKLTNFNSVPLLVPFTFINKPIMDFVDVSLEKSTYATLVIDSCVLLISMVNMYSMTAILYAMNNHWDALYTSTGTCNHRGTPNVFNPLQQISLGQATVFLGSIVYITQNSIIETYYSELWTGLVIIFAAFISTFHLKRPDSLIMGVLSIVLQISTLGAIAMSLTMVARSLVEDSTVIYRHKRTIYSHWQLVVSIIAGSLYLLEMITDILFIIGIVFRAAKRIQKRSDNAYHEEL